MLKAAEHTAFSSFPPPCMKRLRFCPPPLRTLACMGALVATASSLVGCDVNPSTASADLPSLTSRVDGRPIVTVSQEDIAFGRGHLGDVRHLVASVSPSLASSLAAKAEPGSDSALLKDVLAATVAKSSDLTSTHIRTETPDGQVSEAILTLEHVPGTGAAAKSATTTVVVLDPDLFGAQDLDEVESVTVRASVETPDGLGEEDVIIDANGNILSPGLTEASLYYISATTYSEREYSGGPLCWQSVEGGTGFDTYVCDPDVPPPPPPPSSTLKFFNEASFLALRGVQLSSKAESGSAEVVIHVQPNDDYGLDYSSQWSYRFDKRLVVRVNLANIGSALLKWRARTPRERDSLAIQFQAIQQAAQGSQVTYNTRNQGAEGILYHVPDVNNQGLFYSFTAMETIGARGVAAGQTKRLDGFPLHELTGQNWRAMLVEKDNFGYGYDNHTRKGVGGGFTHAENVNTYDMAANTHAVVNTRISARRGGLTFSDDVLENSGFRRANQASANARLNGFSTFDANTGLFRYQFGTVRNRMVVDESAPGGA